MRALSRGVRALNRPKCLKLAAVPHFSPLAAAPRATHAGTGARRPEPPSEGPARSIKPLKMCSAAAPASAAALLRTARSGLLETNGCVAVVNARCGCC